MMLLAVVIILSPGCTVGEQGNNPASREHKTGVHEKMVYKNIAGTYLYLKPTSAPDCFIEEKVNIYQSNTVWYIAVGLLQKPMHLERHSTAWRFTSGDMISKKDNTGKEQEWCYLGYDEVKKVPYLYDRDSPEDTLYLKRVKGKSKQTPYFPFIKGELPGEQQSQIVHHTLQTGKPPVVRRDATKLFKEYITGGTLPESDVTRLDQFPIFSWEDIPVLLELAASTNMIPESGRIPVMAMSSYIPGHTACCEGQAALYFIEGLRGRQSELLRYKQVGNTKIPNTVYHTPLAAICRDTGKAEDIFEFVRNPDLVKDAYHVMLQAYKDWWKRVKYMNPEDAAVINPLDGTGIEWYGWRKVYVETPIRKTSSGNERDIYAWYWAQNSLQTGKLLRTVYYTGSAAKGFRPVRVKMYYYGADGAVIKTRTVAEEKE